MQVWARKNQALFVSALPASQTSDPKACMCVFGSAQVHLILSTWWLVGLPRPANGCRVWLTEVCCSCVHRQQLLGWKNKIGWWGVERERKYRKRESNSENREAFTTVFLFSCKTNSEGPQCISPHCLTKYMLDHKHLGNLVFKNPHLNFFLLKFLLLSENICPYVFNFTCFPCDFLDTLAVISLILDSNKYFSFI